MCDVCGCGDSNLVPVEVHENLLAGNDHRAGHNREHLRAAGTVGINLMGSPGAGKTALLEATARALGTHRRLAAITGDLETERDADRVRAAGIDATAITTGTACHLDADLVHHALHHQKVDGAAFLFIENVGNLVCPAIYDLGQEANVVLVSVTEGEDKPLKYPVMFRKADLVVITKADLLPALPGFDLAALEEALHLVAPATPVLMVSATTGQGIHDWIQWLEDLRAHLKTSAPSNAHAAHEELRGGGHHGQA